MSPDGTGGSQSTTCTGPGWMEIWRVEGGMYRHGIIYLAM